MIDSAAVQDRLRRTFDAVAATTRVDAPAAAPQRRRRGRRRPVTSTLLPAAALVAAVITVVVMLLYARGDNTPVDVRTNTPATRPVDAAPGWKSVPGMVIIADEKGHPVGYARESDIHAPHEKYAKTVNARTKWPVTSAAGEIIGYIAPDVPFITRAQVEAPGFDLETVRAARNGGCEDQIGDPNFKQEFPPCHDGSGGH